MIVPARGKYLCEILEREKLLPSGIYIADRIKSDKKDNVARCMGVGDPIYDKKGKNKPIIARRTDVIHYKQGFGKKLRWEDKNLIVLTNEEIIAVERKGMIIAPGSMVICKLVREDNIGSIILSDGAKLLEGNYHGLVVSVGPEYPDKLTPGDKIIYYRDDGYKFKAYESREELISIKECWIYGRRVEDDR